MRRTKSLLILMFACLLLATGCGGPKQGSLERADGKESTTSELDTGDGTSTTETTDSAVDQGGEAKGEDSGTEPAGKVTMIDIDVAGDEFRFVKDELKLKPGTYKIRSKNPSSVEHNIAVEGDGVDEEGELVTDGAISEVTVTLKAGEYEFYCTPHRSIGMKGKLIVA